MPESDRQKWDARYAAELTPSAPSSILREIRAFLESQFDQFQEHKARALDIAGGSGRHALPLARLGYDVTIADISEVGLESAQALAQKEGLSIRGLPVDLETSPIPQSPWDLIFSSYFLHRPLYTQFHAALNSGGLLAVVQPTKTNLQRYQKPPAQFLLEDGELPGLLVPEGGWEILHYRDAWTDDGPYEARLLARKK